MGLPHTSGPYFHFLHGVLSQSRIQRMIYSTATPLLWHSRNALQVHRAKVRKIGWTLTRGMFIPASTVPHTVTGSKVSTDALNNLRNYQVLVTATDVLI